MKKWIFFSLVLCSCDPASSVRKDIAYYEPMSDRTCIIKAINATSTAKFAEFREVKPKWPESISSPSKIYYFKMKILGATEIRESYVQVNFENHSSPAPGREIKIYTVLRAFRFPEVDREIHERALGDVRASILKLCGPLR